MITRMLANKGVHKALHLMEFGIILLVVALATLVALSWISPYVQDVSGR